MIERQPFAVTCSDGVVLKGILLIPESPKAMVQFNGGTAAKKEFYLPFLEYLAEHNYLCCLWDYRGSGESAPASLKGCDYTFHDYGMQDMYAVKSYLLETYPQLPLFFFGHSAGGQQMGLMKDMEGIQGMVGYAVSTGYLPHMPIGYRILSAYFFLIFSPISILLTGFVNAKRFGIMEDLPKKVVQEWRAWCLRKHYLFDGKFYGNTIPKGHYQSLLFPFISIGPRTILFPMSAQCLPFGQTSAALRALSLQAWNHQLLARKRSAISAFLRNDLRKNYGKRDSVNWRNSTKIVGPNFSELLF